MATTNHKTKDAWNHMLFENWTYSVYRASQYHDIFVLCLKKSYTIIESLSNNKFVQPFSQAYDTSWIPAKSSDSKQVLAKQPLKKPLELWKTSSQPIESRCRDAAPLVLNLIHVRQRGIFQARGIILGTLEDDLLLEDILKPTSHPLNWT